MRLNSLSVNNFKNTEKETVSFTDGINIIFGDNAAGKTNLLEAIFLFAAGKSFRGSKDKDFIRFGQDTAFSEIEFENKNGPQKMGIRLYKNQKKQIFRSGVQVTKLSEYLEAAANGERVLICKRNHPIAELRAVEQKRTAPRTIGGVTGVVIPPSFFEPMPDAFVDAFESAPIFPASRPPSPRSRVAESRSAYGATGRPKKTR
jgi:antitoxin (DNA-binding transcriptional repressor) of toxin-antitoxin stability system